MPQGNVLLLLHAHLPFVRHPEHDEFLEEDWLYEAITETYLPLLEMGEDLEQEGVRARFSIALSPPLCEMLADPLLQARYLRRLHRLIDLAGREVERTRHEPLLNRTARHYLDSFRRARMVFEDEHGRNILRGFRRLQDAGRIEILTCGATHGFFPLMSCAEAVRAQVRVAAANYEKHFGRRPAGIWLPECGYRPGQDAILAEEGISYFCVETHAIAYAAPRPKYTIYAPVRTPSGVCAFGRDIESSRQVWSASEGYPGDAAYREFYRDLGYDGEESYVKPYLHADGVRRNLGIKYYRITGRVPLNEKQPYDPDAAAGRARVHAANFLFNRQEQVRHLAATLGRAPTVLSPYDAELFGHWWYEGPQFLAELLRRAGAQTDVLFSTPRDILGSGARVQRATPTLSTWGDKGYCEVWLNPTNDWIYRHQHVVEERMVSLARDHRGADGLTRRALNQAARETLLAQSSDWAFIMNADTAVPYAHKRFKIHVESFHRLHSQLRAGSIDETLVSQLESRHNAFPEIDWRAFAPEEKR
ncbi:MAG: 1,4-alpha-glucan branching protein domain-containing protein [Planctomycetota bacterium]